MEQRIITLKRKDRKPAATGAKVRVEAVHQTLPGNETSLMALINGIGLRDVDKDGLKEQDLTPTNSWVSVCATNLRLEFAFAEPIPLGAIEIWNYNAEWQTSNGVRKADVAISLDGITWQSAVRGAEIAAADGTADYDEPTVVKLDGSLAQKVRLENLMPWGAGNKVGLGEVVFREALGPRAGTLAPEDGASGVACTKPVLEWEHGWGATKHRVFLGAAPDALAAMGTTKETKLVAPTLKPATTYYWRVDEVQRDGKVVTGRIARFETARVELHPLLRSGRR